jgi:hypothetical protein
MLLLLLMLLMLFFLEFFCFFTDIPFGDENTEGEKFEEILISLRGVNARLKKKKEFNLININDKLTK